MIQIINSFYEIIDFIYEKKAFLISAVLVTSSVFT